MFWMMQAVVKNADPDVRSEMLWYERIRIVAGCAREDGLFLQDAFGGLLLESYDNYDVDPTPASAQT